MKTETSKPETFFKKNKVFFVSFVSLALYHLFFMLDSVSQTVNLAAYEFHAVDYSLGFCTKLLPGAIYHLLVGKYNETAMTLYVRIISLLLILLLSILIQKIYAALSGHKRSNVLLFLILCAASPCTFYYALQFEGCLDAYWIILFLSCVLLLQNRILCWGIPLLAFLMILVHEGAILCYIPLICLLLLLKAASSENKKARAAFLVVFVLTVVVSLGVLGYFMLNNHANLKVADMSQLDKFLDNRGSATHRYYEWAFWGVSDEFQVRDDYFPAFMNLSNSSPLIQIVFKVLRQIYYTVTTSDYINPLLQILYSLPLFAVLTAALLRFIKRTETKLLRFLGLCFLLLPLLSIFSGLAFSNDVLRWFSHALICLFSGVISVSCLTRTDCFNEIEVFIGRHSPIIIPYLIGYPILMV